MVWAPPCPLHALTGLECPLCGGTRAVFALAAGHWGDALRYNPLLVIGCSVLLARLLWMVFVRPSAPVIPPRFVPYVFAAAAGFAIARNIAKIVFS